MPTVPTYGQRKVSTAALPGVRKTAAETNLSTGVGLDRAQGASAIRQADALGSVGQAIGQVGQVLAAEHVAVQQDEQRKGDEVARLEYNNRLDAFQSQWLYDPQGGALAKKGKGAQSLPEDTRAAFDTFTADLDATLNDRQRAAFGNKDKSATWQNLYGTTLRHTAQEAQAHEQQEFTAFLGNRTNSAAANATDQRRVEIDLKDGLAAVGQYAQRQGLGPEATQDLADAFTTKAHVSVIKSLIAQDQPQQAQAYYAAKKDQISGTAQDEIARQLDVAGNAQTGLRASETIWQQLGPKTDDEALSVDKMETAAREQFKDDPKALDMTLHFLRERVAGVKDGRQERAAATSGAVLLAISKGASLQTVTKMPEFLALDDKKQAAAIDNLVGRAEKDANRRYLEASRDAADESRAYTREQRQRAQLGQKQDAQFYALANPETLAQMSIPAIQARRLELGDENTNKLLEKRATLTSPHAIQAATIDDDLFKAIAGGAGFTPYAAKLSDADKATLGNLKNAVETAIDAEQQRVGKVISRDEKQKIMHTIVDQRVLTTHNWFSADPERIPGLVTDPTERAAAYVPIAKIPTPVLGQSLNYVRGLTADTQRMTDGELRARYGDRIERAWARRLLGGLPAKALNAEITKILRGETP